MKRLVLLLGMLVVGLGLVLLVRAAPTEAQAAPGAPHVLCMTYSGGTATFVGVASDILPGTPVSGVVVRIERLGGTLPHQVIRGTTSVGTDGRWTYSLELTPGSYRGFFQGFNVNGSSGPAAVIDFDTSTLARACLLMAQGYQGYSGAVEAYISMWNPGANHRWDKLLKVRSQGVMKGLGHFDLSPLAGIEAGDVVGASLVFWVEGASNPQPAALHVYPIALGWNVDVVTWMAADLAMPWTLPGANAVPDDYLSAPTSSAALPSMGNDWVALDATELLRGWLDGSIPDYGYLLTATARGSVEHYLGTSLHTQPGYRPILAVEYNP